jgi:glycosyltransferase involved in cell wall biosynthesis
VCNKKKSRKIDLIITPELNRTKYLKEIFYKSESDCFLTIPNTNSFSEVEIETKPSYSRKVVTHIGAVGLNHHIKNYLEAISKLDETLYEFRFIGLLTDDVIDLIRSHKKPNIIYVGQVLHNDLKKYYLETDIGVILYKDVSLNHRFCAPNKLYEYWSYGIPVLGDKLPGLEGVFTEPFLGELIDMNIPSQILNAISKLRLSNNKKVIADFFQSHLKLDNYLEEFGSRLAHK